MKTQEDNFRKCVKLLKKEAEDGDRFVCHIIKDGYKEGYFPLTVPIKDANRLEGLEYHIKDLCDKLRAVAYLRKDSPESDMNLVLYHPDLRTYYCDRCGSHHVQIKAWVDPNDGFAFCDDTEEDAWCLECEQNVDITVGD